jgi:hypothetical protein
VPRIQGELTILSAASLTDAFKDMATQIEQANPGTKLTFNFAGSSTLRTQLAQGARAFISMCSHQPGKRSCRAMASSWPVRERYSRRLQPGADAISSRRLERRMEQVLQGSLKKVKSRASTDAARRSGAVLLRADGTADYVYRYPWWRSSGVRRPTQPSGPV